MSRRSTDEFHGQLLFLTDSSQGKLPFFQKLLNSALERSKRCPHPDPFHPWSTVSLPPAPLTSPSLGSGSAGLVLQGPALARGLFPLLAVPGLPGGQAVRCQGGPAALR